MRRYLRNDQRGFVSLLSVTLMSIVILLLTVGMVRLVNGELHQATDTADSVKAYYTAQGAAEDAAQQLRSDVETGTPVGRTANDLTALNQGCGSSTVYTVPSVETTSLKCIKVTTSTTQVNTELGQNQTQTYDLSNSVLTEGGSLTRLVVSWDDTNVSGGGSFTDPGNGAVGSTWNVTGAGTGNQPPVMELGITNYFPNQNTNVDRTYSGTVFLAPRPLGTTGAANTGDYLCYLPNTVGSAGIGGTTCATGAASPVYQVSCTSSVLPKRCTAQITDLVPSTAQGDRTVLTVTPLFHDAQFTLTAYATQPLSGSSATCQTDATTTANNDCVAPVDLQNAEVDVTATVGGTTRRVVLSVPVRTEQVLNNVLEGDSDICKSFDILNIGGTYEVAQPNGSDKPSCIINDNLGSYDAEPLSGLLSLNVGSGSCPASGAAAWQGPVSVIGAAAGDRLQFAITSSGGGNILQTVTADGSGDYSNPNFTIARSGLGTARSWNIVLSDATNPTITGASSTASC